MAIEDEMKDVQQLVVNQLGVANGLDNSIADGQVTPAKLSTGAPEWASTGNSLSIKGNGTAGGLEINTDVVGDGAAYIDFHSTSSSNPDYDARIYKTTGGNPTFELINKGSGETRIYQDDKLKYQATSAASSLLSNAYSDSRISCYDSSSSFLPSGIQYTANTHIFKDAAGSASTSYIQMNMTNDGHAELVVASADATGDANLKLSSFTPSIILEDKTTSSKDFQILADNGTLRIQSGDTSGDAQLTNELLRIYDDGRLNIRGAGEGANVYIKATRDDATQVDRLELQGDEVAIMSGTNYATEALKAVGGHVYVPNGNFLVGTTSANTNDGVQIFQSGEIYQNKEGTQSAATNKFIRNNTPVGSITTTGSTTSFNTSSDYRLKTDAQPMVDASARVQALNPVNFEWISSGERVDGFLAHEAQEVVPEAVHGTKDALDEEGNPEYQGIDQSKLVPLLTKALQEALTKIEALEARVTALEA